MTITVTVTDMSCDGCEDIVEGAVADVSGVESVEADRSTESVTVEGDADVDAVVRAIDFAGYNPVEDSVTEGDAEPAADESQPAESEEDADAEDDAEEAETEDASEDAEDDPDEQGDADDEEDDE